MIEFASKAAEELIKAVRKMKNAYVELCRRVLLTYNRCQTSAVRLLEVFLEHETFLKQLQEQCSEDERAIQLVEKLDEEVLRTK